ncbi:hypothetical protein [Flavobacterium rhizosphaerae]|uniref:Holin n=1 Tax=Flavobacterium rhizosphaerae TaxID=3163298 RepID=A0ABW8Z1W3_9FLAO
MVLDYVNSNLSAIILKVVIIFFTWLIVLVAVGIDLRYGIRKSKSIGDYTHSAGLRRTVKKIIDYLAMMVFMFLFDSINPLGLISEKFNILPLASIIGAIILVWIEFVSVREKADEKFRRRTDKTAREILDIALKEGGVLERLKSNVVNNNRVVEETDPLK